MGDSGPSWTDPGWQQNPTEGGVASRSGNNDLYVIKADGTGMQQITANGQMDANASWR